MIQIKIGIIGLGYVGSAVDQAYRNSSGMIIIKIIDPAKGHNTSYHDLRDSDAVFVCVPSPNNEFGQCDTSALESVLLELKNVGFKNLIISKVTADPRVYNRLGDLYPNLVHVPEFLTAANANADYKKQTSCIIGGNVTAYLRETERILRFGQTNLNNCHYCTIAEAALYKYVVNSFLATKVVFMNEISILAEKLECDYATIRSFLDMESRIGMSHTQVPGPDGMYGFGGVCFPKDTQAFSTMATELGCSLEVLDAAIKKNTFLRLKNTD